MNITEYYPEWDSPVAVAEQAGNTFAGAECGRSGTGVGVAPGGVDMTAAEVALQRIAAGTSGEVGQREFQAGIEAGQLMLGNRAFVHWVETLGTVGQAGAAVVQGRPDPLQLMSKKKKKRGATVQEEGSEMVAGPVPASAGMTGGAGPESVGGGLPVSLRGSGGQPRAEPEPPLPLEKPEESTEPGQKKKKKKSRVQVALNTLRADGVEEFGRYIHAEISELELLRTLTERIGRAQDLRDKSEAAQRAVQARLRTLDHESVPAAPRAPGPGQGQATEKATVAPVMTLLSKRERELFECYVKGDVGRFKHLLRFGKVDINVASEYGTLLGLAAYKGHTGIVRELLPVPGIDVNLGQQDGMTPLYLAVQEGHVEIVRLLLATNGININLAELTGNTPLCMAAVSGREEIVKLLLADPNIKVNAHEDKGVTPLYYAVQEGFPRIVKLLLAACGININQKSITGTTPLCSAAEDGLEEIVKLLLAHPDIDVNARKGDGATPVFLAAQYGFPRVVELLLKCNADVNLKINAGTTALCIAAKYGHIEVIRLLLQSPGIRVNDTSSRQLSAIAIASAMGHRDIVKLLLREGADPNIAFNDGLNSLHFACLQGHTAIVRMLLDAGADTDACIVVPGLEGYAPYRIAQLAGARDVMNILDEHRWEKEEQVRLERLSIAEEPGRMPLSTRPALPGPATAPAGQSGKGITTPQAVSEQELKDNMVAADEATADIPTLVPVLAAAAEEAVADTAPSTLAQAKKILIREVLMKLEHDTLEPLEGIRLLVDVRASESLEGLSGIYNRLAGIERQRERDRRRGVRRGGLFMGTVPAQAEVNAPAFALGKKAGMDAERVEEEIKGFVKQAQRRFVGQIVNDMEFGRGKPTSGYPGLWHASAGIPGVGSCSVFYYSDRKTRQIRIVGIGHHVGRSDYRLTYAIEGLGDSGRILRIA